MVNAKRLFESVNIYFALWCLYRLQGSLYPSGSIVSKILLLILMMWSLYIFFKVNMKGRQIPHYFRAVNAFLLVTTLYGVMLIISGQELYITEYINIKTSNLDYLKHIYMSLLPVFVFYYYSIRGNVTMLNILIYIVILLLINLIGFFDERNQAMMLAIQNGRNVDGFTLNVGYKFLALFPLILLYNRKPILQYVLMIITLFLVVICMKRGAILIAAVCFIYFIYSMLRLAKGKQKVIAIIMSIVAILMTIYVISTLLSANDYFVHRIEQTLDGNSSNRDELYSSFINHFFSERSFLKFIFGNGANATLKIGMNYAHNDWLELAINNGVVGLVLYLWYYIALLLDRRKLKKENRNYANVIMMALIVMFASSLFSMSYSSVDKALAIALGFVLAKSYNTK